MPSYRLEGTVSQNEFKRISGPDGQWYERRVTLEGHTVAVRMSTRRGVLGKSLPYASALCADPDLLASRFKHFKATEAARNPALAGEVLRFVIDHIDFVSPARPDVAEVSFTAESGGESWTCLLVNGEFRELILNT
jgi:hypothetical protein